MNRIRCVPVFRGVLGLSAAAAAPAAFGAVVYEPIALSGDAAPGVAGGTFRSFVSPTVNDRGEVAFRANFDGAPAGGVEGIWAGRPGSLSSVHRWGEPAPGASDGAGFVFFSAPLLNNSGAVAFLPSLNSGGDSNSGIWVAPAGPGAGKVAREGEPADGATFGEGFGISAFNDAGQVAFSTNSNGVLWLGGPGGVRRVGRDQGAVPRGSVLDVRLNRQGSVAFPGTASVGKGPAVVGYWTGGPDAVRPLVVHDAHAPGTPAGVRFDLTSAPNALGGFNDAGEAAVFAYLRFGEGGVTLNNDEGLWVGTPETMRLLMREGDAAPGMPAGYTVRDFTRAPSINGGGAVAFTADARSGSSSIEGLYAGTPGNLRLVTATGQAAPGTPAGVTFGPTGFSPLLLPGQGPAINAAGQVAFLGSVRGPGVTEANNDGIWATTPQGVLVLVAREGDLFDVDPATGEDLRAIRSVSMFADHGDGDGRWHGLNALGQVAFRLEFSDGTSGLVLATVPEPSAGALLLLGTWPALARRRRVRPSPLVRQT